MIELRPIWGSIGAHAVCPQLSHSYNLTVLAASKELNSTSQVIVSILDVNDNFPIFDMDLDGYKV